MENFVEKLQQSLYKSFVDRQDMKAGRFKPQLLLNRPDKQESVLTSLLEELDTCTSFLFSVAFITESGLAVLKAKLHDLHQKGIQGRILTSTFLQFNQPKAFRELMKLPNVDVRLTEANGFHAKGYIFERKEAVSLIVGSSNLTAHALKVNYEWNVHLTSHENGEMVYHFKEQFDELWNKAAPLTDEWISEYEVAYEAAKKQRDQQHVLEPPLPYDTNPVQKALSVEPNRMQRAALSQLQALRKEGKTKALVISATGTGKTYLSAFDVRAYRPKRMLFVVHREQILQKAMQDYKTILGGADDDFGLLAGGTKQSSARYVFATIQTLSRPDVLAQFSADAFDYILMDESHRAGATTYRTVLDHFQPAFLLGMTATPERMDSFNIYELYDYNIAYEIRLQEALEEDMLCPFHYFGVTDMEIDGELVDEKTAFSQLISQERVSHIVSKINYYGYSGQSVKGLVFCSRKEEAKELSRLLNERGFRTVALTGEDSQAKRLQEVERLENGDLDYVLTVDIFNEGIDIPCINQVVMLRQTESSIVFVQQLGRGLRKHESKEFVTVIDFIGNYKNNYLIPVALSGDQSQNKDTIRRKTAEPTYITGVSTIHFEEIARRHIFRSINSQSLNSLNVLKEAFLHVQNKIGRMPLLHDFAENQSIDPLVIAEKYEHYGAFLQAVKAEVPPLSFYEEHVLKMITKELVNGKRRFEPDLLLKLMAEGKVNKAEWIAGQHLDHETVASVERILTLDFFVEAAQNKYGGEPLIVMDKEWYSLHPRMARSIQENAFFRTLAEDALQTALWRNERYQNGTPFVLHEKYGRKDVCRLLNWDGDETSTMYGYKTKHGTCPIFVTYHKDVEIEASRKYGDAFLSPDVLHWYTRSKRTLQSKEVREIVRARETDLAIHLFVKKDDDEGTDFYYVGQAWPDQDSIEEKKMQDKNGKDIPVVTMNLLLEHPVEHSLYHYLTEDF